MSKKWVVNASPLILLAKVGYISLLDRLTDELVIPVGVVEEIQEGPEDDPARGWLSSEGTRWIQDTGPVAPLVAAWDLGKGESQVISWAYQHPDFEAIVDDRAARNCAAALGLGIRGTLGVILLAKQAGEITMVSAVFEALQTAGLRIDTAVLDRALRLAGE